MEMMLLDMWALNWSVLAALEVIATAADTAIAVDVRGALEALSDDDAGPDVVAVQDIW